MPGLWIGGSRGHAVWYRAVDGSFPQERFPLSARTLLWRRGPVSYRLEADVSRAEALRIARSLRVDPGTGTVRTVSTAPGRVDVHGLAAGGGFVWLADNAAGRLHRLAAR